MDETPNLKLPYILAAQAQKHVTHNEAIRALDAIVQIGVLDRDLVAPPPSPSEGDRYIVASGATGDWSGKDDTIAAYQDGTWLFYVPSEGWVAWVADENLLCVWDGAVWVVGGAKPASYTVGSLPSASSFGAGTLVYVADESGGAVPAFSDGTDWRRVTDRAVVA